MYANISTTRWLSMAAALFAILSACLGLFYTFGGQSRVVTSIYGEAVELYGDGIYANDSLMKVGASKGTDIAIILMAVSLTLTVTLFRKKRAAVFLRAGLLSIILYASTCLAMGVNFNRLFPLYVLQFGCSLFAFIGSCKELSVQHSFEPEFYDQRHTGTALFLVIGGCSTLIWLSFIIPTVIDGQPMAIIEVYTSEPTFVLDLAVVLPSSIWCGLAMLRRKPDSYQFAPILLALLTGVGIIVIFQSIVQSVLGITPDPGQLFGLVISFIILGTIAVFLNVRLLKRLSRLMES